jgi:hypothetical protein
VASDLRIHEALERYYGAETPARFVKLLDRLNRAKFLWREEATPASETQELPSWELPIQPAPAIVEPAPAIQVSVPAAPPAPAPAPVETAPSAGPAASTPAQEPAPASARPPAIGATTVAVADPAVAPEDEKDDTQDLVAAGSRRGALALADAEQLLLDPKDRDDVARTLLEFATTRVRRAVMLVVRKQEIAAWLWSGEGLDGPRLAAWRAGLEEPSIFLALQKGAEMFRGVLPPVPAHRELLAAFDPPTTSVDLVALPLRVRGRLVASLVVEPATAKLDEAVFSELQRIAAKAAIAFELCIMRAKLKKA